MKRPIVVLISVALAILLCWIWLAAAGSGAFQNKVGDVNLLALVLILLISAVALLIRFFRWQYLLRRAEVRVPIRRSLVIYLGSLAGIVTPFSAGELIRCWLLKKRFDAPLSKTIGVFVLERTYDALALCLILWVLLPDEGRGNAAGYIAAILIILLAIFVLLNAMSARSWKLLRGCFDLGVIVHSFSATMLIWILAGTVPALAAIAVGSSLPVSNSLWVMSDAILEGSVSVVPVAPAKSGELMQAGLTSFGLTASDAVLTSALFGIGYAGIWWAVGGALLFVELTRSRGASSSAASAHFDAISGEYAAQFSEHVWNHLLERKISMVESAAEQAGPKETTLGLDLGCGLGLQYREMARRGFHVVGVDASHGLLRAARRAGADVATASATQLPFPDQSLDFVFTVGVMHHLSGHAVQDAACSEVARVLKPGGQFIIHESNPRNPLFRFYMGYVFPLLKSIDEGTEWWIETERWQLLPNMSLSTLRYFTFLPDFIPSALMGPFVKLERWLERSRYYRHSVHYMAVLTRR